VLAGSESTGRGFGPRTASQSTGRDPRTVRQQRSTLAGRADRVLAGVPARRCRRLQERVGEEVETLGRPTSSRRGRACSSSARTG
jgi:hypothetical protein